MSDNSQFMQSINLFIDKAKSNQEEVVRATGLRILAQLVNMSPVGNPEIWEINSTAGAYNQAVFDHNEMQRQDPDNLTKAGRLKKRARVNDSMEIKAPAGYTGGRFRGNWQVSFNQPADGVIDRDKKSDPGGNVTLGEGKAVIEMFKVGINAVYFANNVPYSYRLEMGHSTQAPAGMIRVTAAEIQQYVDQSAREVNK
ncbi:hypothetical protein [Pragia fontium]|uniref:hypothetical protein n=1 Tax=Pragia fontium TaxID=82985 RepID=UPI000F708A6F|nr:hypothetical protein [Pragia fontium]VEJ54629.1 Uncharacterised protein [Pragia fontium]